MVNGAFQIPSLICKLFKGEKKTPEQQATTCACGHSVVYHNESGCQFVIIKGQVTKYNSYGDPVKWEPAACTCVRYVGPGSTYDPGLDADIARAVEMGKKK